MSDGMKTIIYPVKNMAKSRELFAALLGVVPYVDQPYYIAFNAGGHDIGLDPNGHARGMLGCVAFWHVADIEESIGRLGALGAHTVEKPKDVGGGNIVATLKDADGNMIGLFQAA